ncbi:MAG: transposase [Lentisphaerae bacterium]|nr:transposase [Lentisphaerota bacterium]
MVSIRQIMTAPNSNWDLFFNGCQSKPIPPRSPECNGYMESFIKTFKTECLNHLILSTESQLRYVINEFLE